MADIFDNTFLKLEGGLQKTAKAQQVIAHNIANANNPDYVPLDFSEELNRAVKRAGSSKVILEDEMAKLSRNSITHSAYVKLLASKIAVVRSIVTMGRK